MALFGIPQAKPLDRLWAKLTFACVRRVLGWMAQRDWIREYYELHTGAMGAPEGVRYIMFCKGSEALYCMEVRQRS